MRQHVPRQLGLSLAEYLCAYFLSLGAPTYTFRPMLLLPFSLGFSTFSSRRPVHYTPPPLPPPSTLHHPLPPEIMVPQPSTAAPRNKLVIRRLPPTLPEDIFWQSVSTWITDKTCLWKSFVKGKAGDRSVVSN